MLIIKNVRRIPDYYPCLVYENLNTIRRNHASINPLGTGLEFHFSSMLNNAELSVSDILACAMSCSQTATDAFHYIKPAVVKKVKLFDSCIGLPVEAVKVVDDVSIFYPSDYLSERETLEAEYYVHQLDLFDFKEVA